MSRDMEDVLLYFYGCPNGIPTWTPTPAALDGRLHIVYMLIKRRLLYRSKVNPNDYHHFSDNAHPEIMEFFMISTEGAEEARIIQERREKEAREKIKEHLQEQRENERDRKDTIRLALEIAAVLVSFIGGVILQDNFDLLGWFTSAMRALGR